MLGEGDGTSEPTENTESLNHILTHDLRNQLSIIKGNTEHLLNEVNDSEVVDRLETIKRQTIAAEALLSTVGDQTRGGTQEEIEHVDVSNILSTEIDRLRSAYPEATITDETGDHLLVQGDNLLTSVFANVIENAIQHDESSTPHVHVSTALEQDAVEVFINDDGPGIPDEVRNELLGRNPAHPLSGAHIVRSLVEKYGGDIAVDSDETGTSITVRLPKARGLTG